MIYVLCILLNHPNSEATPNSKITGAYCRYHKVNLKAKIYIHVNSTTQRCPNKIITIFLLEGFFHLPTVSVSLTPVANLELQISQRIFEKIQNGPNGIIRGLGETDLWKKTRRKKSCNLVTLSLSMDSSVKWIFSVI